MYKVFSDFHHAGAAQGSVLLLQCRLGHEVWFPDTDFVNRTSEWCGNGVLLPCLPFWAKNLGGLPPEMLKDDWKQLVNWESFMDMDWDVFLVTRVETQPLMLELKRRHPKGNKIKLVGVTGNDNTPFDWKVIRNLMSSDFATFENSPKDINKVWYSQEIGRHYGTEYVPITDKVLHTVNSFVQCWPSMRGPWYWYYDLSNWRGNCPYCSATQVQDNNVIDPYGIWDGARKSMPDYVFGEYGMMGRLGSVSECDLPREYAKGALTVHMKTYDGYGFSMLQSIVCGRPVIVPKNFHKFRTAGRYLIPDLTCFTIGWSADELVEKIKYVTETSNRADAYGKACYKAAQGIFNWELEARKVEDFWRKLI
jgi:hypothetical protein